jgi:hypothetical protein
MIVGPPGTRLPQVRHIAIPVSEGTKAKQVCIVFVTQGYMCKHNIPPKGL